MRRRAYIIAKVAADGQMAGARSEIESLLRQRHRIPVGQEDDFKVQDPAAAMEAQQGAIRTLALLLVAIASVSLLVGGISIMNVMIVSVTERTREIGIRRPLSLRRDRTRSAATPAAVKPAPALAQAPRVPTAPE
ncbi:hypothetical protein XI09_19775 [Bradyrhizobium sp. CCBAU 11386]|nr:hypothetical protein [Bradyrhizobium sp. CCBAU 11386]MDA9506826.1 hypothetical protein [Bradyrhizobium sp. CCBAU 11386]